ncbi:MAG: beta-1,6-N-acetylglucosaminyltransferase [Dermatophilus congolensis]|nr:beta-1,6-N-acetylglucosaminyltransferase [Dermatophilus congolensis]
MTTSADASSGPTFCYLLMCHTDPQGVLRLVRRIKELSPTAQVVVRHDVEGLLTTEDVERAGALHLPSSVRVKWAGWSMVEAEIELFCHGLRHTDATHFVLVSGQDYPITRLGEWERQVAASGADALLTPMPPEPDDYTYTWTVRKEPERMPSAVRSLARVATGLHRRLRPVGRDAYYAYRGGEYRWWFRSPRTRPAPVTAHKCSQWVTLSRGALEHVVGGDRVREYQSYFRTVRGPDEYYVPSVVYADPALRVAEVPTTAARFEEGESSPVWLTETELQGHLHSPAAFARKLPPEAGPELIAAADDLAARREVGDALSEALRPVSRAS